MFKIRKLGFVGLITLLCTKAFGSLGGAGPITSDEYVELDVTGLPPQILLSQSKFSYEDFEYLEENECIQISEGIDEDSIIIDISGCDVINFPPGEDVLMAGNLFEGDEEPL